MFERLDDPDTFNSPAALLVKVTAAGRARRRRRRAAYSGSVTFAVIALAAAPVLYLRQQANELEQVQVGGLTPISADSTPPATQPGVPEATTPDTPPPALAAPINILVVGVDARPEGDEVTGSRTDTIAVVRLDPVGPRLTVLSIPRDLWVPIAGRNGKGRINSTLAAGRETLVQTVSDTLGVEINHYMEIDFAGFARLVDLAGGVDIAFDATVRDRHTGFTAEPGCAHLDGAQSLAYVRSRHFETLDPATGKWTQDPTSDLGRMTRQQDFAVRALDQILTGGYGTIDQLRILTDVLDDVTVDEGLDVDGLRAIWNTAADAGTDGTTLLTLNDVVSSKSVDGASVLVVDPDDAKEIAAPFRGETPPDSAATSAPTTVVPDGPTTAAAATPEQVSSSCPAD